REPSEAFCCDGRPPRPAPREALVAGVPEAVFLLADPPAEQHFLAVSEPREIDEPLLEVLDDRPELLDLAGAGKQRFGPLLEASRQRGVLARRVPVPVSCDSGCERRLAGLLGRELLAQRDHPLRQRTDALERGVGLLRGEV